MSVDFIPCYKDLYKSMWSFLEFKVTAEESDKGVRKVEEVKWNHRGTKGN
jgi:hypothetical protein